MREILFRGKRVDNGEWITGDLIANSASPFVFIRADVGLKVDDPIRGKDVKVIQDTVGQFTGLTDKNGKRIFEGDVLSYIGSDYTYVISYENGCFIASHTKLKAFNNTHLKWGSVNRFNELSMEVEVIGNIHVL